MHGNTVRLSMHRISCSNCKLDLSYKKAAGKLNQFNLPAAFLWLDFSVLVEYISHFIE